MCVCVFTVLFQGLLVLALHASVNEHDWFVCCPVSWTVYEKAGCAKSLPEDQCIERHWLFHGRACMFS